MPGPITEKIIQHAQAVADTLSETFRKKGPGRGNKFTNQFMTLLNERVRKEFGSSLIEQRISGPTKQSVDFYVRPERTVIEVELSLYNVHTNMDRDIFKVLLARDSGEDISTLLLLGKEPAVERHTQPASQALLQWVRKHHALEVLIRDIKKPRRK